MARSASSLLSLLPLFATMVPLHGATSGQTIARDLRQGINQFAIEAYTQVAREGNNVIFSPFSLFTALSMALNGAGGETAKEIAAVLHQQYPQPKYNASISRTVEELIGSANANGTRLFNANGLWVDQRFSLQAPFQQVLEKFFGALPIALDFSSTESARAEINRWTAEHSNNRIAELFGPGALDRKTRLILSSAIYFNGKWQSAFQSQKTLLGPFHPVGPDGRSGTVQVDFMNQSGRFGYAETPSLQIVEMKYAGGTLAFEVLLPKPGQNLAEVERSLKAEALDDWLGGLHTRTVEVALPKFRTDSSFSLAETLAEMGMPGAFSRTEADFSRIDGRRDLFLSGVIHEAFVDVSEEGTEAAAATGIGVSLIATVGPGKFVFRADHPFLYFIRDTRSGVILFAGRLMNPRG